MNLNIIMEDSDILVCEKPIGLPVQTNRLGTMDLFHAIKNYLFEKNNYQAEPYLGLIHRLDQPVGGIMVFAKTPFAAAELSRQLTAHLMSKYYLAIACGIFDKEQDSFTDYLLKDGKTNISKVVSQNTPQAKKSELHYTLLETLGENNLLKIDLITGRHHQIRVQMAHHHHPLWGDNKYNPAFSENTARVNVALFAYQLEFIHPRSKKPLRFVLNPQEEIFQSFQTLSAEISS